MYWVAWVSSAYTAPEDAFRGFIHRDYRVADHHPVFVVVQRVQGHQGFMVCHSSLGRGFDPGTRDRGDDIPVELVYVDCELVDVLGIDHADSTRLQLHHRQNRVLIYPDRGPLSLEVQAYETSVFG